MSETVLGSLLSTSDLELITGLIAQILRNGACQPIRITLANKSLKTHASGRLGLFVNIHYFVDRL